MEQLEKAALWNRPGHRCTTADPLLTRKLGAKLDFLGTLTRKIEVLELIYDRKVVTTYDLKNQFGSTYNSVVQVIALDEREVYWLLWWRTMVSHGQGI